MPEVPDEDVSYLRLPKNGLMPAFNPAESRLNMAMSRVFKKMDSVVILEKEEKEGILDDQSSVQSFEFYENPDINGRFYNFGKLNLDDLNIEVGSLNDQPDLARQKSNITDQNGSSFLNKYPYFKNPSGTNNGQPISKVEGKLKMILQYVHRIEQNLEQEVNLDKKYFQIFKF